MLEKLEESGLIMEYAEYLESLTPQSGLTEVIQDDRQTMNGFMYYKRGGNSIFTKQLRKISLKYTINRYILPGKEDLLPWRR